MVFFFFFQAEDGIRDIGVTGVQTCALPIFQGLSDGRFALLTKTHHALVDGVSGVDLATVIFDLSPEPQIAPHEGEPWERSEERRVGKECRSRWSPYH